MQVIFWLRGGEVGYCCYAEKCTANYSICHCGQTEAETRNDRFISQASILSPFSVPLYMDDEAPWTAIVAVFP